jgi:hypothetical protein
MKQEKLKDCVITARAWGIRLCSGKLVYGIPIILNDNSAIIPLNKNEEEEIAREPDREDISLKAYIIRPETLKVDIKIEMKNVNGNMDENRRVSLYDLYLYKDRLLQYLHAKGIEAKIGVNHCFSPSHNDDSPSCQISEMHFFCHGCGIQGDIYDAIGILEDIPGLYDQYIFVKKMFDSGPAFTPVATEKSEDK